MAGRIPEQPEMACKKDVVLAVSLAVKKRLEADYVDVQVLLSRSSDVFLELAERTHKANDWRRYPS